MGRKRRSSNHPVPSGCEQRALGGNGSTDQGQCGCGHQASFEGWAYNVGIERLDAVNELLRANENPLSIIACAGGELDCAPLDAAAHNGYSEVVRELVY